MFAAKISNSLFRSCQVSFVYVIVTNHVNWHRENLHSDRENSGNLKMQLEWVPCFKANIEIDLESKEASGPTR